MSFDHRDDVPDPLLANALAELRQDAPADVDWERMQRSIHDRAALVFARRRRKPSRIASRPFVPLAMAASVALALWTGPALIERMTTNRPGFELASDLDAEAILREALSGDLTDQEFDLLITGRAYPEALLAVAVDARLSTPAAPFGGPPARCPGYPAAPGG